MGNWSQSHLGLVGFTFIGMLIQAVAIIVYMRAKLDSLTADVKGSTEHLETFRLSLLDFLTRLQTVSFRLTMLVLSDVLLSRRLYEIRF